MSRSVSGLVVVTDVRRLDFNHLVVLNALLSERNLTKAAARVGMTQPSMSAALNRLRDLFGDPLLERAGRGFVLTPRAEELLPRIAECIGAVRRTFEVLPTFDPASSRRTFLVSASDYVLTEVTSPLLGVFGREAPHTRVAFEPLPLGTVSPTDLLRRDVTIAATGRGVPGKQTSLFSDQFVCIADAGNPHLVGGRLSVDHLRHLRHVRSAFQAHGAATPVDDMLMAADIVPRVSLTVPGFMSVPFAVAGTSWVGWVPERTAHRYCQALGLVVAETPLPPTLLVEAAFWHPSKSEDPALKWLLRCLRRASVVVEFGAGGDALEDRGGAC